MKTLLTIGVVLLVSLRLAADEPNQKADAIVVETTATEMAKEFKDDVQKAMAKYNPNPPKGKNAAGGAIIKLTGECDKTVEGGVYLKTGNNLKLFIKTTDAQKGKNARTAAVVEGKFKSFENGVITVEGTAKFEPIIGK